MIFKIFTILISFLILIGNAYLGFVALIRDQVTIIGKRKLEKPFAKPVGGILLVGMILSPFTYTVSGFLSIVISIALGLWKSEPVEAASSRGGFKKVGNGFQVARSRLPDAPVNREREPQATDLPPRRKPIQMEPGTPMPRRIPLNVNESHDIENIPPRRRPLPETLPPIESENVPARKPNTKNEVSDRNLASNKPVECETLNKSLTGAVLEVKAGNLKQAVYHIKSDNFLIGRGVESNLPLLNVNVSQRHARLRHANGNWYIQDQGSTNGVLVNGQRISACRLNSGDEIAIAHYRFIFRERQS